MAFWDAFWHSKHGEAVYGPPAPRPRFHTFVTYERVEPLGASDAPHPAAPEPADVPVEH
jgi:hypothetical protein